MRQRLCRQCGNWHDVEAWPAECYKRASESRSAFPVPHFVCDTQDALQSQADGKWYTSKSAMRASYKADNNPHGVNFTEVGNEDLTRFTPPPKLDRKANRDAIERAICAVESGSIPPVHTTDSLPL